MDCRSVVGSLGTQGFTPICILVNSRPFCVSGVYSCVTRGILRPRRQSFGRAILFKTSAATIRIISRYGKCPVVTRFEIIVMGRTRGLGDLSTLRGCLRGPIGSAILIVYGGGNDVSHEGGFVPETRRIKIIFRDGGLCSHRLPNFVRACLGTHGTAVRPGTIRVITSRVKTSLRHLASRLSGLLVSLPSSSQQIAPSIIRHRVKIDGSFGTFRLHDTVVRHSIFGTGRVVGCFSDGPGSNSLCTLLPLLFDCFRGLVVTCCTPGGRGRGRLTGFLSLHKA